MRSPNGLNGLYQQFANWLESYADSFELNVWTSSTVTSASRDAQNKWNVTVKRIDGSERVFKVNHLVFATGLGGGEPNMPSYPGMVSPCHFWCGSQ
jgi:cation diffusion facilitator CzcD-associated flavoprotein CzcO